MLIELSNFGIQTTKKYINLEGAWDKKPFPIELALNQTLLTLLINRKPGSGHGHTKLKEKKEKKTLIIQM